MKLNHKTQILVQQWLNWDKNPKTRRVIEELANNSQEDELANLLDKRIEFGTAGIRGIMNAGFANMNDLVIIQTTQGVAVYLENNCCNHSKSRGVVVGYDSRHNSRTFAQYATAYLAHRGFKVFLFDEIVSTPLVAFAVLFKKAIAGMMITASHNSKVYNGCKIYWESGVQINRPHDKGICDSIEGNLEPWEIPGKSVEDTLRYYSSLIINPFGQVVENYFKCIKKWCFFPDINASSDLKITYTPLHGVGGQYMRRAFAIFEMKNFVPVKSQMEPDPDFPTVEFPNPEEGFDVFKLAMETADSENSPLIIANDPDADRMSVAEKQSDGSWRIFTGNEIGVLLANWILTNYLQRNPDADRSKLVVINSVVSSKALQALAQYYGILYRVTLSGFKWIADLARSEMMSQNIFLFAYEEAIGYMIGSDCLDKDGIISGVVFGEMANSLYSKGLNLARQLAELEKMLGHFSTKNGYFFFDQKKIFSIFSEIRNGGTYAKTCGRFEIRSICDLTAPGYDSSTPNNRPTFPVSSQTQMIIFTFSNDATIALRSSGTEPKLKYYSELPPKEDQSKDRADSELNQLVEEFVIHFIQPGKYGI